jgi:hypothetical protein
MSMVSAGLPIQLKIGLVKDAVLFTSVAEVIELWWPAKNAPYSISKV